MNPTTRFRVKVLIGLGCWATFAVVWSYANRHPPLNVFVGVIFLGVMLSLVRWSLRLNSNAMTMADRGRKNKLRFDRIVILAIGWLLSGLLTAIVVITAFRIALAFIAPSGAFVFSIFVGVVVMACLVVGAGLIEQGQSKRT